MIKIIAIQGPVGTFKKFETVAKSFVGKSNTESVLIDVLELPKEEDFAGLSLVLIDPKTLV